jgi:hypothetical protein
VVRFPTQVKIKDVSCASDATLDSSATVSLAIDFNIAFSDSTIDGTLARFRGLIPTTANTGATTTVGSYSSPNVMFGTNSPGTSNGKWALTNVTLAGIGVNYSLKSTLRTPLWATFGFTSGAAAQPFDPGGNFDLLLYESAAAGTAPASPGNLLIKPGYVK